MDKSKSLLFPFSMAMIATLLLPFILPSCKILSFAPFFTIVYARQSFFVGIWVSAFVGLLLDFYTTSTPMGFMTLNYVATTYLIYRFHRHFLEEQVHTFALYTLLFSCTSTCIHFLLYAFIDGRLALHPLSFITDLVILPFVDALYALLWILYPMVAIDYLNHPDQKRKIKRFLINWKKRFNLRQLKWLKKSS